MHQHLLLKRLEDIELLLSVILKQINLYYYILLLLNKNTLIKHLTSVMRAPVRSSLANRGAEPSRQARESVHFSKNEKKNCVCKKNKKICTRRTLYQRRQQVLL